MQSRQIIIKRYEAPCGTLVLGSYEDRLCLCDWIIERHRAIVDRRLSRILNAGFCEGTSPVIEMAEKQLNEYFCGKRKEFDIPQLLAGTEFQEKVWTELQKIPYGATVSYAELAQRIGMPKSCRAVANANGANAISVFVPCHRVIGSDGSLTGYGGGLETKLALLQLEADNT